LERDEIIHVQQEANQDSESGKHADIRAAARKSLLQILEPLAGFGSDLGFSAGEMQEIFREAAVKSAAARQLEVSSRINISGIAATTGIPRNEISRILKSTTETAEGVAKASDGQQQSTNRILAAWHQDPKFTDPNGQPADLKLYGRGATFEALAKRYGRGIPTRAVLDELIRVGAIELLPTQKIRAKSPMTVDRGMSTRVIRAFGDRASELFSTMLSNMRKPETPKFIANVSDAAVLHSALPLFRKELSARASDFLTEIQESLSDKTRGRSAKRRDACARVSITIYCHESANSNDEKSSTVSRRRNFRRES
jgi:hypothetical protein